MSSQRIVVLGLTGVIALGGLPAADAAERGLGRGAQREQGHERRCDLPPGGHGWERRAYGVS